MLQRLGWPRGVVALAVSTALLLPLAAHGQPAGDKKPAWAPETSFKIKKIGNVQPSPDGKRVLFTITETVLQKSFALEQTQVYVANDAGSNDVALDERDRGRSGEQLGQLRGDARLVGCDLRAAR